MAVYAWGRASDGQLGLGGIEEGVLSTPTLVGKFPITAGQLKDIVCGWEHSAFLTDDGILYTCGKNDFGQLGHDKGQTRPGTRNCQRFLREFLHGCLPCLQSMIVSTKCVLILSAVTIL